MTHQDSQDWARKLEEIEQEINQNSTATPPVTPTEVINPLNQWIGVIQNWLNGLPKAGKIAVVAIALIISFSLLSTVLHIITSLLSIALLGGILYVGYRVLTMPSDSSEE